MKKLFIGILLILMVLFFESTIFPNKKNKFHVIPERELNLDSIVGDSNRHEKQLISGFEISDFVTLKDYKLFLKDVQHDSSAVFYQSQLPDSTIADQKRIEIYLTNPIYEKEPIVGISWEAAMNYCKWKTRIDHGDSLGFSYRLPLASEWISAYTYFKEKNVTTDMNEIYSDWLLSAFDESIIEMRERFAFWSYDYCYEFKQNDPPILKKKMIAGNSFFIQSHSLLFKKFGFYSTHNVKAHFKSGRKYLSFRMVKNI